MAPEEVRPAFYSLYDLPLQSHTYNCILVVRSHEIWLQLSKICRQVSHGQPLWSHNWTVEVTICCSTTNATVGLLARPVMRSQGWSCSQLIAKVNSHSRLLYVVVRPSVCRLSVTFVRPTQAIWNFRQYFYRTVYPHPSTAGRAQDRVSSPAKDRRSASCATQPSNR